jgi:hypothetical protein
MKPSNMPKKGVPVRTTTRERAVVICDYCNSPSCFDSRTVTERVLVLRPLGKRNTAMADALAKAGLR